MKRKALITATAVLLVAVMCLATASYAWFTTGTASTVTSLGLHVTASDGGIEIATADLKNGHYAAGSFGVQSLDIEDFEDTGILPSTTNEDGNYILNPVSTDLVAVSGDYDFFPATYDEDTMQWTTDAEAKDGYVLVSFYARSSKAASAPLNISIGSGATNFKNAAKVAVDVADVTLNADNQPIDKTVLNGFDTAYSFSEKQTNALESYYACTAAGAVSYKNTAFSFEPVAGEDNEAKFTNNVLTDSAWTAPTVTFAANQVKLITVAVWIEGMDDDCSGSWNDDVDVTVAFGDLT